jgi:lipid-A-disaccharide synthase
MKKRIFIVAGEASGDIIGANLINAMQDKNIEFRGIGGQMMQAAGADIIFHYKKISVIGFVEIFYHFLDILRYMKRTVAAISEFKPDIIVTIDSPGFNFRLIKEIKKVLDCKAIHYVAPTVWAYGEDRAQLVSQLYKHILLILPFEEKYFQHMSHTFVGHPIVEEKTYLMQNAAKLYELDASKLQSNRWTISILPGSRKSEIKIHMQTLLEAMDLIKNRFSEKQDIKFKILTLPHLKSFLEEQISDNNSNNDSIEINDDVSQHDKIIQESIIGIVKSGTSTMRFMANGTPAITFYKVSPLSAWIIKKKLKILRFNLCNIIMFCDVLPELIQDNFTATNILEIAVETIFSAAKRHKIMDLYLKTWDKLQQSEKPSQIAAKVIYKYLKNDEDNTDK